MYEDMRKRYFTVSFLFKVRLVKIVEKMENSIILSPMEIPGLI